VGERDGMNGWQRAQAVNYIPLVHGLTESEDWVGFNRSCASYLNLALAVILILADDIALYCSISFNSAVTRHAAFKIAEM